MSVQRKSTIPQPRRTLTKLTVAGWLRPVWLFLISMLVRLTALGSRSAPPHQPRPPLRCRLKDRWRAFPTHLLPTIWRSQLRCRPGHERRRVCRWSCQSRLRCTRSAECTLVGELDSGGGNPCGRSFIAKHAMYQDSAPGFGPLRRWPWTS